jgi:hypothetical protein
VATVAWISTPLRTYGDNVVVASWTPLTTANADGQPFEMPGWADRSVHLFGTPGATPGISIQGSNEATPTNWKVLSDPSAADLAFTTSPQLEQILQVTRWIRPLVTGGDGATSWTVLVLVRRG